MPIVATDDYDVSEYNIIVHQGTTFKRSIVYKNDLGVALTLGTAPSARMKVRKYYPATLKVAAYADSPVLDIGTSGSGATTTAITITSGSGLVNIDVTAATMAGIPAGIYDYDLELTLGTAPLTAGDAGDVVKLITGLFEVKKESTY
jgi:hypothetical protein